MSTDIHHFWPEYSYTTFDIWVNLIQLGHNTANRRLPLHQVDFVFGISQIQGGLDSSHATADH